MPRLTFALAYQIRVVITILFVSIGTQFVVAIGAISPLLFLGVWTGLILAMVTVAIVQNRSRTTTWPPPDSIGVEAIRSAFSPIAQSLTIALTNSDFSVNVIEPPPRKRPQIIMNIPSEEMGAFERALSCDNRDATGRFFAVLAHELGHVVYRDNSRLEWLIASIVLPILLITATMVPFFSHQAIEIDYADGISLACVVCVLIVTVLILRNGEYYADAFSTTLLGRDTIASVLDRYARREKYIQYPLTYRLTHPTMRSRAEMVKRPTLLPSQSWSIGLLTIVYFFCFCILLPQVLLLDLPVIIVGTVFAYGIPILGPILIGALCLFAAWVVFCLLAPIAYLGAELGASASVAKGIIGGLPAVVVGAGVGSLSGYVVSNLKQNGTDDAVASFFQSVVGLLFLWIVLVSLLIVGGFGVFWVLARMVPAVRNSMRLRRKTVAICVVAIICVVVLQGFGVANVGVYIIAISLAGALMAFSPILDGDLLYAHSGSSLYSEVDEENILLGADVGLFRIIERIGIAVVGAPFWMVAYIGGMEMFAKLFNFGSDALGTMGPAVAMCAPLYVYRWMGKQQRRELSLRRVLMGVTS